MEPKQQAVLVTTKHRGVFFGYVDEDQDLTTQTMSLDRARMAIRWATKTGIAELASRGPNENSQLGAVADIACLHDITAVWKVTEEAEEKWINL